MRTLMVVLAVVLVSALAHAQGPTVTTPKNGDRIGPAIDVNGNLGHYGLIVVITDVYKTAGNEKVASIPGIRHYTEKDGSFAFHVATPRNAWGEKDPLTYKVRVLELKGPGNPGPETVITCTAAGQ